MVPQLVPSVAALTSSLPRGRTLPPGTWQARHRGMLALLWCHVVALPVVAVLYDCPLRHALTEAFVVAAFALAATLPAGGRRLRALLVALGLMTASGVLVHLTGGLVEAHFHFFVMVTVLSLYEDWPPFLAAGGFVLVHHGIGAALGAGEVFPHGDAWLWAAVHAGYISALSVANVVVWRAMERERRRTAGALDLVAASEERYRLLVESLEEGVLLVGPDGVVVTANPGAERIFGTAPGGLSGRPVAALARDAVRADGTPVPAGEVAALLAGNAGTVSRLELGLARGDGAHTWLLASSRPLGDASELAVCSLLDVTAQREGAAALTSAHRELERRAKDLERSNAELEQFAYVASHDLSEPLRMVSSYLQLLRRRYHGRLDADADQFIDYAVDGAARMRDLIDDLLAYSRVGRTGGPPRPVDCRDAVERTLRVLAGPMEAAGAKVDVGELPVVTGDAGALGQLFQNLVANALKFRAGDRAPRVRIGGERGPGGWTVRVADNGIGVDRRHRERIFKMFQRLHTREAYEGTGIGLAVCRKIVERHGGRIWVEPTPGGGATFCFTLPDRAPAAAPSLVAA